MDGRIDGEEVGMNKGEEVMRIDRIEGVRRL